MFFEKKKDCNFFFPRKDTTLVLRDTLRLYIKDVSFGKYSCSSSIILLLPLSPHICSKVCPYHSVVFGFYSLPSNLKHTNMVAFHQPLLHFAYSHLEVCYWRLVLALLLTMWKINGLKLTHLFVDKQHL